MSSLFRIVFFAMVGVSLTGYAMFQGLDGHPGAAFIHHLVDTSPVLKALLFLPPAVVIAIAGLVLLAVAVYRVRVLWITHRPSHPREAFFMPPIDRAPRRMPAPQHAPAEQDYDEEEYGPGESFNAPHHDRRRGNGQFESQRAEVYR